ncbi:MAG: FecR domain-containing protein [Leptospirales bacterium]|nr:FecR domain-containing protein [Leptospirales bacterium]
MAFRIPAVLLALTVLIAAASLAAQGAPAPDLPARNQAAEHGAASGCSSLCQHGNCQTGSGRVLYADCSVYEGQFQNGRRHGSGTYRYANGDTYSGGFVDGQRHGQGEYRFANGASFRGQFADGAPRGAGIYRFEDGRSFEGQFRGMWQAQGALGGRPGRPCLLDRQGLHCSDGLQAALLVLYAGQDATVERGGQSLAGRSGMALLPGDRILAGERPADIQAIGGLSIRLRPYSVLLIPADLHRARVLVLERGSVLVDYKREEGAPPLQIRSAGARFQVHGTTFVVELDEGGRLATLRVFEGEVGVSPDLPGVDRIAPEELQASSELRRIVAAIEHQSVTIGAGQQGALDPAMLERAQQLDRVIIEAQGSAAAAQAALQNRESQSALQLLERSAAPESAPATFSAQEQAERALIVRLPDTELQSAIEDPGQTQGRPSSSVREAVGSSYNRRLDAAASDLQQNLQRETGQLTHDQLRSRYQILEIVTFRSGSQKAGSVVAQAGEILIMHATDGVFRIEVNQIDHIDYYSEDDPLPAQRPQPAPQPAP